FVTPPLALRRARRRLSVAAPLSAELADSRHERLVHAAERLCCVVGVLADLVGDLCQPLEVGSLLELRPELADEVLQVLRHLLNVVDRSHTSPFSTWTPVRERFPGRRGCAPATRASREGRDRG